MSDYEKKGGRPAKDKTHPFNGIFTNLIGDSTQQEVADKIGVSRQNVGKWISGNTTPDITTLCKIADAYGVSTDYLLGRTPNKSNDPNLTAACEYTGLSEKTVEFFHYICDARNGNRLLADQEKMYTRTLERVQELKDEMNGTDINSLQHNVNIPFSLAYKVKNAEGILKCHKEYSISEAERELNIINALFESDKAEEFIKNLDALLNTNFDNCTSQYSVTISEISSNEDHPESTKWFPISSSMIEEVLYSQIRDYLIGLKTQNSKYTIKYIGGDD